MKKKGFTLIELLAVIVILAIIALIATPIVMNVIENSKKGAAQRGADNYVRAVETAIATERLSGPVEDGEYTVDDSGNLVLGKTTIKVEVNGDKPLVGSKIKISDGLVDKTNTTLTISGYPLIYNAEAKVFEVSESNGTNTSYICEKTGEASKTVGAQYTCHLDTDRTFYVLENIESSENISLIMDRNFIGGEVPKTLAWCTDGGSDNTTCKNINLKEENPLKHIQDTFGDNVEVSFPTKDQITSANNGSTSNLPQWLYDHLNGTPNPESGVNGYWTASPRAEGAYSAWYVGSNGLVSNYHVGISGDRGVRPVITISKTELN